MHIQKIRNLMFLWWFFIRLKMLNEIVTNMLAQIKISLK